MFGLLINFYVQYTCELGNDYGYRCTCTRSPPYRGQQLEREISNDFVLWLKDYNTTVVVQGVANVVFTKDQAQSAKHSMCHKKP